jgi:hypothetical protein
MDMKDVLRTVALLTLLAACGADGDGGDDLAELGMEYFGEVDALCARANECYQPDAEPGDEDFCKIPNGTPADEGALSASSCQRTTPATTKSGRSTRTPTERCWSAASRSWSG